MFASKMRNLLYLLILSLFQISIEGSISDYIKYTESCIVQKTEKEGIHRILKECPSIVKDIISGESFPRVCEEDTICKDVVCCPEVEPINDYHLDIPSLLRKQLFLSPCNITGNIGIFKPIENCDKKLRIENDKQICKFDFCGEFVCCKDMEETKEKDKFELPDEWKLCSNHNNVASNDGVIGEECTVKATGETGICRDQTQCPFYKQLNQIENNSNITFCGYESCLDIVCCPQIDFEKTGTVDHYCYANQNYAYKKVRSPDYIDKGRCSSCISATFAELPSSKEYPHVAALGYQSVEPTIHWSCVGSLINNRFIITAAHCIESLEYGLVKYVRLGAINVYELPSEVLKRPKDYNVEERILHPEYISDVLLNDIGLLKLDQNVEFSIYISPICLPSTIEILDTRLIAIGWGSIGFSKPKTDWLIKVQLEQIDDCDKNYTSFKNVSQICVGSKSEIDDCPGDSGGALMIEHPIYYRRHLLIGVSSFGKNCGSLGIYTRVFAYLDWINEIIWN